MAVSAASTPEKSAKAMEALSRGRFKKPISASTTNIMMLAMVVTSSS